MADEFKVDLAALEKAASGITGTLVKLRFRKVSDLDPRKEEIGHSHLADVLESFCTRWEIGVENLAKDVAQVSQRLNASAKAYREIDGHITGQLGGTVTSADGKDPGVR
ncbi:hypothetical protein [Kitasatospora purpeofusca]|uniref:hypothetical protein n=1 Tax=Kitasatospora purpeofusca TaxID=67352 RepID=UPI002A5A92B6|nr:hypothetical protein [Kitasatospora purpeofusca]MDY0809787.1 hypothetical protein [Kitasatospora purpeofusca]